MTEASCLSCLCDDVFLWTNEIHVSVVSINTERLKFVWKTRKFREEFKWNSSSQWKFSEVLPFPRFYRNDRNFLYHLFELLVPGLVLREGENLTGIL